MPAFDPSLRASMASALSPVFALENDRTAGVLALCAAIGFHAALAVGASTSRPAPEPPPFVSEIELAPPPPPPPPPPPEEPAPKEEPAPAPPPRVAAQSPASPPPAARAGAIVAADPAAKGSEDLVDFVSNPAGTSYGSGVVARDGTAERSTGGRPRVIGPASASSAPAARDGDGAITPAASLSRTAQLQGDDPCRGFYPGEATEDSGSAALSVVILPSGQVARASIASEDPPGQGFGSAARRCLASSRFSPALDKSGRTVTAAVTVRVRFTR